MINIQELTNHVNIEVGKYLAIQFKNILFPAPYAINEFGPALGKLMDLAKIDEKQAAIVQEKFMDRATAYGWYVGKATAQELTEAIPKLLEAVEIPAHTVSAFSVMQIMNLYGLGVDCSGFVFNVLAAACSSIGMRDDFIGSLDWRSETHDVTFAGTFVFAGSASHIIEPNEVRNLDVVLIRSGDDYVHIGLIVEHQGELRLVQSALLTEPAGVTDTAFSVRGNVPVFSIKQGLGSDWNDLYDKGYLEFRRLAFTE